MINQNKTEALLLRNNASNSLDLSKIEIKPEIHQNFEGSLHLQQFTFNFESTEKSLRDVFNGWGWRGLTMTGKIYTSNEIFSDNEDQLYRHTMTLNEHLTFSNKNKVTTRSNALF